MRVHATSRGLEPGSLVPGEDLVLELDPAHGLDLPHGVLVDDHLDGPARAEIDVAAAAACTRLIEQASDRLTVDGIRLPWIWEVPLIGFLVPLLVRLAGLRAAIEHARPDGIELTGGDEETRLVVETVAPLTGVAVSVAATDRADRPVVPAAPLGRRLRRPLLAAARLPGVPTHLRRDSVVFVSYWPLLPLLDHMTSAPGHRPAVLFDKLPTGPGRAMRAAARGGWIGSAGPLVRRGAENAVASALAGFGGPEPLDVVGIDIGAIAHARLTRLARERGAADVAKAAVIRRAFARRPPHAVVSAWDSEPDARLVITLAKEAGVRTYVLAHGVYLLPQESRDMNVGDEIVLWSHPAGPPVAEWDRPVHVIGYPVPHEPPPPARPKPAGSPVIGVLVQARLPWMAKVDDRIWLRHYIAAIEAVRERVPDARIVLRPHPSEALGAAAGVRAHAPGVDLEIDTGSPIVDFHARCDLCIGSSTAATLQAALAGTQVIALNVTGIEWRWPLGGDTGVPVARSPEELREWLDRWAGGELLPGREDLVAALGADGGDATERFVELLGRQGGG